MLNINITVLIAYTHILNSSWAMSGSLLLQNRALSVVEICEMHDFYYIVSFQHLISLTTLLSHPALSAGDGEERVVKCEATRCFVFKS